MNWEALALLDVHKRSGTLHAAKMVRRIGQGGPMRPFLSEVHPFTRTVRIILGVARAWEAKIDNRLYEVGVAEAWWVRTNERAQLYTERALLFSPKMASSVAQCVYGQSMQSILVTTDR
jgi:hypothetical protein